MHFLKDITKELADARIRIPEIMRTVSHWYKKNEHPKIYIIDALISACLFLFTICILYGLLINR